MTVPTISPLPPGPKRSDPPQKFAQDADAFAAALPPFGVQANALAEYVDAAASAAAISAAGAVSARSAAEGYRNEAQQAAQAAASTAGAARWVSGATYAQGDAVWSPIDLQTYRRSVAGAGTTDPSADPGNWERLGGEALPDRAGQELAYLQVAPDGSLRWSPPGDAVSTGDEIVIEDTSTPFQHITLAANNTAVVSLSAGVSRTLFVNPGTRTVTWPASVAWASGSAPSLKASRWNIIEFVGTPVAGRTLAAVVGDMAP